MAKGKYEYWLTPEGLLKLEGWARDGLTDEQIAENAGINPATLYVWKKKYPEISESLKRGKEVVDRQVENALLKRALGYEYEEVKEKFEGNVMTERTVTKKEVVPDVTAQIFWLKNRKRETWADRQNIEISQPIDDSIKEMEAYFEQLKESGSGPDYLACMSQRCKEDFSVFKDFPYLLILGCYKYLRFFAWRNIHSVTSRSTSS